jgi:hypothetical protein
MSSEQFIETFIEEPKETPSIINFSFEGYPARLVEGKDLFNNNVVTLLVNGAIAGHYDTGTIWEIHTHLVNNPEYIEECYS